MREKDLETLQFLGQTLDVIQSINTDNDLFTLKLGLQTPCSFSNMGFLDGFDECIWVDTDREGSHLCESTFKVDTVGFGFESENTGAGGQEMSSVVVGVKPGRQLGFHEEWADLPDEITL